MTDQAEFSRFLASLYDCAIAPGLWERVLPKLSDYMESNTAAIAARQQGERLPYFLIEHGLDEHVHEIYVAKYRQQNPRLPAMALFGIDEPVRTEDMLDVEDFKLTTYFKEFHQPYGIGEILASKIVENPQRIISCNVSRPHAYTEDDVAKLRNLCPHIRRVMTISELLERRTVERDNLAEVLDRLAVAVIMVDPKQRIVHKNTAADDVLTGGGPLTSTHGVLTSDNAQSREALRQAAMAPDLDLKSIPLKGRNGEFMVATVLPLNSGLRKASAKPLTASAAVFVHHPPIVDDGLVTTLSAAFRLTGAEARVMASLLEGLQISDIAQRYAVAVTTVRTQIQRLFEKTNTKRQSDLVRVVSNSLPPVRVGGASIGRQSGHEAVIPDPP
jgi:DNA-binding CsgD family transcriptional regulator